MPRSYAFTAPYANRAAGGRLKAIRPLVRRELGSVDPLRYVALARPGTLLLEDGIRDEVVPRKALENMIHAAPPKTVVRWYPAAHALNAHAYDEAFTWLLTKLGVARTRATVVRVVGWW